MASGEGDIGSTSSLPEMDSPLKQHRYLLELQEVDGKDVFWTGALPLKPSVAIELTENDIAVPIELILSTYLPGKVLSAAEGDRHLQLAGSNRRVQLKDEVRTMFGTKKEATLYLNFGAGFRSQESETEELDKESELHAATEKLKEVLQIPGFLRTENGIKFQRTMAEIDQEFKVAAPNHFEIQQKLNSLNELVNTVLTEHRTRNVTGLPLGRNYVSYIAYGALFVLALAYFLFKD